MMKNNKQSGIAALPVILIFMIFVMVVGLGITNIGFNEAIISTGSAQSSKAFNYAEAGAKDGLMRIARDSSYTCPVDACYSIDFSANGCSTNEACAKIKITAVGNDRIIVSEGRVKNNFRRVQVTATLDADGTITGSVWEELTN
jgi:Tfp pilus assembly protein PilX